MRANDESDASNASDDSQNIGKLEGKQPVNNQRANKVNNPIAPMRAKDKDEAGGIANAHQKTEKSEVKISAKYQGAKRATAPMRAASSKALNGNVLDFNTAKKSKEIKAQNKPPAPPSGRSGERWLKTMLPPLQNGAWWEVPAGDKGFRIKLRWRAGGKKPVYTFSRLGKRELEELTKGNNDKQRHDLSDRLIGELMRKGDRHVAIRFAPVAGSNNFARAENF